MEKKVSNTRHILEESAQKARKNIDRILQSPKRYQDFVFNSTKSGLHVNDALNYWDTSITNNDEKIHVVERRYRIMRGSNGNYFIKAGAPQEGVTYTKKGRVSSRITVWGRFNILSILERPVFKFLVDEVNPSAKELLNNPTIKRIATNGLIGSILAGKVTTRDEAMKYRITYLLKRSCGIQKEDSDALYHFYEHFNDRLRAEVILYNSLDPRAIVNLFDPLFGDHVVKQKFIADHKSCGDELQSKVQVTGDKIDWTAKGFNPKDFLDRISRKEKGIKDIVHLWGGGPVLSRKSRSVKGISYSVSDDLPF
jgi:hypothetical protein